LGTPAECLHLLLTPAVAKQCTWFILMWFENIWRK
jgi:hypothetical protein